MSKDGIVVLSLFDGMSCGQIALDRLGIKVKAYYAAEIDKHAINVAKTNYPDTIHLGDVTRVKASDLPKIDLLIGGSPCQGFSFAGKQLAFDDPRSKLFFEFVMLKNELNPRYFMLENVKMKTEFELIISKYMGIAPIEINSNLVSAQNRERLYWTNINAKPYGLFGDYMCMIPQPKDKGILLKNVLESDVPDKYYLKSESILKFVTDEWRLNKKYTQINGDKGLTQQARQYSSWCGDYIAENLSGCIKLGRTEEAKQIRKESMAKGKDYTPHAKKEINGLDFGKMNTLTTSSSKDNLILTIPEATKKGFIEVAPGECFDFENPNSETRRGRKMDEKSNSLMAKSTDFMQYTKEGRIRRLTPLECERLQTVPDNYTASVSDTQRYKMLGNGWTVDVICHIFSYMDLTKL